MSNYRTRRFPEQTRVYRTARALRGCIVLNPRSQQAFIEGRPRYPSDAWKCREAWVPFARSCAFRSLQTGREVQTRGKLP